LLAQLLASLVGEAQAGQDQHEHGQGDDDGGEDGQRVHGLAAHGQIRRRGGQLGCVGGVQVAVAEVLLVAAHDVLAMQVGYSGHFAL